VLKNKANARVHGLANLGPPLLASFGCFAPGIKAVNHNNPGAYCKIDELGE